MKNIDNNIRYEMYDSIWKYSWQPVRDIVHSNVSVDIIKKGWQKLGHRVGREIKNAYSFKS